MWIPPSPGVDADRAEVEFMVRELQGREPGGGVGAIA